MKILIHNIKVQIQKVIHKFGWQVIQYHPLKEQDNTYEIQKNLLKNINVKTVFDVGAWIGQTAETYKEYFPNAEVHAFEPFPDSYKKIVDTICPKHENIIANNLAVSDEVGTATFYSNKIETTNSLLPTTTTHSSTDYYRDNVAKIEVSTTTLDEYCKAAKVDHINILKMDIQGGELKALNGASKLLEEQKIDVIYSEISFSEMYEGSPMYHDLAAFLEKFGYKTYNLYGMNFNERGELQWGDAIFYSGKIYQNLISKKQNIKETTTA